MLHESKNKEMLESKIIRVPRTEAAVSERESVLIGYSL
jgi:hypothetical protein